MLQLHHHMPQTPPRRRPLTTTRCSTSIDPDGYLADACPHCIMDRGGGGGTCDCCGGFACDEHSVRTKGSIRFMSRAVDPDDPEVLLPPIATDRLVCIECFASTAEHKCALPMCENRCDEAVFHFSKLWVSTGKRDENGWKKCCSRACLRALSSS